MAKKPLTPDLIFTDIDRLHLLQLTTRRVVAENRSKKLTSESKNNSQIYPDDNSSISLIPEKWRLLPEDVTLYDWQKECLPIWLPQGCGTVKVATGGGKTLFALAAAQALQNDQQPNLRLVIVVPTIPLMFQWRDEIYKGNIPKSAIGLMGGGQEMPPISSIRILICVLNSARVHLPKLVRQAGWSDRMLLVVDECHRSAASQARNIFDSKPRYTLGLSATPEPDLENSDVPTNSAYESSIVGKSLGPIIYDFSLNQSLAAGLLTPFEVWHIGLPLTPPESMEHTRLSLEITDLRKKLQTIHTKSHSKQNFLAWCQSQAKRAGPSAGEAERFIGLANQRKRLLYHAKARTEGAIGILNESLIDKDSRAIVFHESIEEIEHLFLCTLEHEIPSLLEHSQLPDNLRAENIEAFREGVAKVIISAKSLIEGFNVPSADLGIIVASSSSVRQRIQSLGRMLRRKPGDRTARVIVLYICDTEDEAIYERADWENVIGAERNRYFIWQTPQENQTWNDGLKETGVPPRIYKPSSWDIDVAALSPGDRYPGQTNGRDVRVDQNDNLRTEDGGLLQVPRDLVDNILSHNPHRRARITPPGHVIVRGESSGQGEAHWYYLGLFQGEPQFDNADTIRLKIRTISGKRVIALERERPHGIIHFARGPENSRTPEAGLARDDLLLWITQIESQSGQRIRELCWDKGSNYWLEIAGKRIHYKDLISPLDFAV